MVVNRRDVSDNGQACALVIAVVVLIMTLAWGVATLSLRTVSRSQAQTAADAAALAGVQGGFTAATRAATLNGATLVEFSSRDTLGSSWVTISVTVAFGGNTATGWASTAPS